MRKIKPPAIDLDAVAALAMQMGAAGFDQEAVAVCAEIEELVESKNLERNDQFAAILNAIEAHVEQGDGDARVVRHLGDALTTLGAIHLDVDTLTTLTQLLGGLHDHVADRARHR
ncbi:MAG TPA: hypothetical protein VJ787_06950 [Thermoleophilia bacterium]|nr:hypothetical protein [Thermoleophilia bacterium]